MCLDSVAYGGMWDSEVSGLGSYWLKTEPEKARKLFVFLQSLSDGINSTCYHLSLLMFFFGECSWDESAIRGTPASAGVRGGGAGLCV